MNTKNNYLKHFGILGMHWGVRRYQNKDGSLTSAGKKRYAEGTSGDIEKAADESLKGYMAPAVSATVIANSMKKPIDLPRQTVDNILSLGQRSTDLSNEMYDSAAKEANMVIKSAEFKRDLQQKLYDDFGDGCDDKDLFEMVRDDYFREMMQDAKYCPKTSKLIKEFNKTVDQYFDECEKAAQTVIDQIGDKTLEQIKNKTITYKDVVRSKIIKDTDGSWVSYLGRHAEEIAFYDNDKIPSAYPYSMSDYNRDAKSIGKY